MDIQPQPHETNPPTTPVTPHPNARALRSPSNLIASIPGALGYFPNEAVVLINVYVSSANTSTFDIGAYLEADVGNTESIQRALQRIPLGRHVATFAVIVTRVPDSKMVAVAAEGLRMAADEFGEIIEACWIVSEVADGTHYQLLFGPDPDTAGAVWNWRAGYERGTVSSVARAEPMRPLIDHGALPELHRSELFAHFEPVVAADVHAAELIAADAHQHGATLMCCIDDDPEVALARIRQACDVFKHVPSSGLIDSDGGLVVGEVFSSPRDVELMAAMLSRSTLRDCLIVDALARPYAAGAVFLTIARNFSGTIRANALCLWAMVAVSLGLNGWAGAALTCAEDEVPRHSLSSLLANVIGIGQGQALLELSRQGCLATWEGLGGTAA